MASAIGALGCRIEETPGLVAGRAGPGGQGPRQGPRARLGRGEIAIDVGNAGTVLRFVPPVAALTAADVTFTR